MSESPDIPQYGPNFTAGVCTGMPNVAYHADPAVSLSKLKVYLDNPLEYWGKFVSGESSGIEKDPFRIGSANHCYLLEGEDAFWRQFAVVEDLKFIGKENKERAVRALNSTLLNPLPEERILPVATLSKDSILEFFEGHPGKTRITDSELSEVRAVTEAVRAHPLASRLLSSGLPEVTFRSSPSPTLGFAVQCRPDWLSTQGCDVSEGEPFIADLKTVESLDRWQRNWDSLLYALQWPFYCEVMKAAVGERIATRCYFIVAEKQWPNRVRVMPPDPDEWGSAMAAIDRGFRGIAYSMKTGQWEEPGWDKLQVQSSSRWVLRKLEGDAGYSRMVDLDEQPSLTG